jgi:hypothetical protein
MTLTPEQIQSFEARAADGEMPVHPGWGIVDQYEGRDADGEPIFTVVGYSLKVPDVVDIHIEKHVHDFRFMGDRFQSLEATQLAAEHLLREATAPLFNRWVPVTEKMPKPVQVLAHFTNSMGKGRTIHAVYIPRWHMEQSVENDWAEYNEEKDEYYWPEGWYEVSECNDEWGYTFVDEKVTHWMPKPELPRIDNPEPRAELHEELDEHWKGIDEWI